MSQTTSITLTLLFRAVGAVSTCQYPSRPPLIPPTPPRHRLSSVFSPTDLAESGRWSLTSLSFPSSLLLLASFKHSNSSSLFEVSSVSGWEVSGV